MISPPLLFLQIQDENHQLRSKIAELEKRVSDLTATNEFLLDQNAHLRMGSKSTGNFTLSFCLVFNSLFFRASCLPGSQPARLHDAVNVSPLNPPPTKPM